MKLDAATEVALDAATEPALDALDDDDAEACGLRWRAPIPETSGLADAQHRCIVPGEHRMHRCRCRARLQVDEA